MKFLVMCGGTYRQWEKPRQLTRIDGEPLVKRTIRQLRECGVDDIAITSNNPVFEKFGVPVLHHENGYDAKGYNDFTGYWCDAFYPTDEPVCYLFGDVVFTDEAIKTIVETDTSDIEFFASAPPFAEGYKKNSAEPFALKVVNSKHLKEAIAKCKEYADYNLFKRKPIMWELWQIIKNTPINKIDYTNYTVINDTTCDIDEPEDYKQDIYIKIHSYYDDFPDNHVKKGQPYINCYVGDFCEFHEVEPDSIAVMLEPRSIEHLGYEYVEKHPEKFRYIFTYDSKLLQLPQAKFWVWASVWCRADVPKTKGISMISSHKKCCELHLARTQLAKQFDTWDKVDCFGTFRDDTGKTGRVEPYDAHAEYKFAIVMENYIDDLWFTEKILNCFACKTVPIYYGARKIGALFNADGIIQVDDWHDIPRIVEQLDIDAEYEKRKAAIEDNFERSKDYDGRWCDRFFENYGDILGEMMDELYDNQ